MNHTQSWRTFRVTAVSSDPTGGSITWTVLPKEEHFMFFIMGNRLTPATKQTVTVQLADGVDASTGAVVDNDSKTVTKSFCTRKKHFFDHIVFNSTQLAFCFLNFEKQLALSSGNTLFSACFYKQKNGI